MFQFIANGICLGAVFAIVGLGFGLIYTTTRVFHLAHGGIDILTGYALWLAISQWNLPLTIAIPFALVVAAAAGVLLDWSVYQPLARRSASTAVIIISSIGALIILKNILAVFFGNQTKFLRADLE